MKIKCPICDFNDCDSLIVDLYICNNCSHIFKQGMNKYDKINTLKNIHIINDPIKSLCSLSDNMNPGMIAVFEFPSMMFTNLELFPNEFYHHKYKHYFNQMSLMVLLTRCGFAPFEQINIPYGKSCKTIIKVRKK